MKTVSINEVISYARNREFMSGIERDKARVKQTGECFTPTALVQEILDQLPPEIFTDPTKTFLDPSCGDGQFLAEVLVRKMEAGSTFEQALSTIYGVDIMPDNVALCRARLLCGKEDNEDLVKIVKRNIVCADALKYHYRFDGSLCDPESGSIDPRVAPELRGEIDSVILVPAVQPASKKLKNVVVDPRHFASQFDEE